jgi:hypothetical protein
VDEEKDPLFHNPHLIIVCYVGPPLVNRPQTPLRSAAATATTAVWIYATLVIVYSRNPRCILGRKEVLSLLFPFMGAGENSVDPRCHPPTLPRHRRGRSWYCLFFSFRIFALAVSGAPICLPIRFYPPTLRTNTPPFSTAAFPLPSSLPPSRGSDSALVSAPTSLPPSLPGDLTAHAEVHATQHRLRTGALELLKKQMHLHRKVERAVQGKVGPAEAAPAVAG